MLATHLPTVANSEQIWNMSGAMYKGWAGALHADPSPHQGCEQRDMTGGRSIVEDLSSECA